MWTLPEAAARTPTGISTWPGTGRKRVVWGKREDLGGRGLIKKKERQETRGQPEQPERRAQRERATRRHRRRRARWEPEARTSRRRRGWRIRWGRERERRARPTAATIWKGW